MPTYFDPIMLEDTLLNEGTNIYLVKIGDNKFCIKGVSSGLERLPGDPTTHATEYWPISSEVLINLSSNDVLFEENKLTTKPLTTEQIKKFFDFDPNEIPPQQFNSSIKQELTDEWTEDLIQNTFGQSAQNPHSFFFQPVFLHAHHQNPNPDVVNGPHPLIPAILVFHLMPMPENNEEGAAVPPLVLNMLMFMMDQEDQAEEENEQNSSNNLSGTS
ncbi:hypothetical protein LEAN103870_07985 [Legionella anisa]|uniref:Uncharacterized protein n=1 Tax=Legionella anisa TaxID=28082 RepID=A0AAX0WR06_9GAMM|nr:hypothetical protein [Legionella anisa]AWN73231.1 hypothetical protein DLD14_04895 [Legionella anisa]KTC67093.1 hypothetical protein Lani_3438 [Legionella anisa]MBN5935997.1 hypothetical protein [Legionella anisa]MCW8424071.1 hypothetical protein [Legionella anisa]PNL60348.1 hypothetical protein A6J39_003485 [Legionella anisa]